MRKFLKGHCCQWEYRGPTIEKKLNFGEIIFFTDFCFPQTKLIRLASFIIGVHKNDAINKNTSLEEFFLRKRCFSKSIFEWHSYKWGYGRPMIERKNFVWENFFSQKSISYNNFWLVWYELSKGVHTKDDGNRKYAYILNFFLRIFFFEKMFWITLFLVGEQRVKVKWKKAFIRVYFFRHRKNDSLKKSFLNCSVKITIGVPQESWKKLSPSENLVSMKNFFNEFFLNDIFISGSSEDRG